jgi:dTMP kinase
VPDLTLYLDLPVEVGLRRKEGGSGDAWNRIEQKGIDFHRRVRAGYLDMVAQEPHRWVVIDALHDIATVQATIREEVIVRHKAKLIGEGEAKR